MVLKVIKNLENVNFEGWKFPNAKKVWCVNFQIPEKFGCGKFPSPQLGWGICH